MPYKDKEKEKANRKAYYEANKEKEKAAKKAYYEANKEKINANRKAYYEANIEKIKANTQAIKQRNQAYWKDKDPYEENEKKGITEKACPQCKRELPIKAFSKDLKQCKGLTSYCKDCNAYRKSKYRKGRHTLTREYFIELRQKPCTFCGQEATLIEPNGVDRIDSSKDYTKNNVQPSCDVCNRMKRHHSHEFFIEHSKRMLEHLGYIIVKKGQQTFFGD